MQQVIDAIEREQHRREINFRVGDTVCVYMRIKEGDKERVQLFEGVVIAMRRSHHLGSFTVRKVTAGVGIERVFPMQLPAIEKIAVITRGKVRRAKLFYLRDRRGKAARVKERDTRVSAAVRQETIAAEAIAAESGPSAEPPTASPDEAVQAGEQGQA